MPTPNPPAQDGLFASISDLQSKIRALSTPYVLDTQAADTGNADITVTTYGTYNFPGTPTLTVNVGPSGTLLVTLNAHGFLGAGAPRTVILGFYAYQEQTNWLLGYGTIAVPTNPYYIIQLSQNSSSGNFSSSFSGSIVVENVPQGPVVVAPALLFSDSNAQMLYFSMIARSLESVGIV